MLLELTRSQSLERSPQHRTELVAVRDVSHSYRSGVIETPVLTKASLSVSRGEVVAVLGPSGCGKTTLLNLIGGIEKLCSGTIVVEGVNLGDLDDGELEKYRREVIAFVFQFYNLMPSLTAKENVAAGLEVLSLPRAEIRNRTEQYLAEVGLAHKGANFPSQLSGGEQQRVAIARALAKRAPVILADEPTGNLDEDTSGAVMGLFETIRETSGATIILITHDHKVAQRADRIVRIDHGRIVQ